MTNPVKKYIEWSGSKGRFQYYDKEAKENILMPEKIHIIVIDQWKCITGFNDEEQKGIYSNEIKNLKEQEFNVRCGRSTIAQGLYENIKGHLAGGKFTYSVYAAYMNPENATLETVNIKFAGSAIGPWIEANPQMDGKVVVLSTNPDIQKKGATEYYMPIVEIGPERKDLFEDAKKMFKELKSYLLNRGSETNIFDDEQEEYTVPEGPQPDSAPTPTQEPEWLDSVDDGSDDLPF